MPCHPFASRKTRGAVAGCLLACALVSILTSCGEGAPAPKASSTPTNSHPAHVGLVPAVYEPISQSSANGDTAKKLLGGLGTDFVFRGVFMWGNGLADVSFKALAANIDQLRDQTPHLLFEGGIGTQFLEPGSTWANGSPISTSDFDNMIAMDKSGHFLLYNGGPGYVPDLASALYRSYVIGWGEKQIDAGVDGLLFDDPYIYADYQVAEMGQNPGETYKNYSGYLFSNPDAVVRSLRAYAASKGREFFATTNLGTCDATRAFIANYPYAVQSNDYISCSFETQDFDPHANPSLVPKDDFGGIVTTIRKFTRRPIITFIDWPSQMTLFQELSTQQQITALTNIYRATKMHGLYFALPVYVAAQNYDAAADGTYGAMARLVAHT